MSTAMVRSKLKVIIAQRNLERAQRQEPELTVRSLAEQSGISPSVITGLTGKRAKGVQFATLDRLCKVLNCQPGDILVYEPDEN